jgi:hypothetical protein
MHKNFAYIAAFDRANESLGSFARKKVHPWHVEAKFNKIWAPQPLGRTNQKHHQRPERRECEDHLDFNKEARRQGWRRVEIIATLVRSVNFIIGQRRQGLFHLPEANNICDMTLVCAVYTTASYMQDCGMWLVRSDRKIARTLSCFRPLFGVDSRSRSLIRIHMQEEWIVRRLMCLARPCGWHVMMTFIPSGTTSWAAFS